MLSVDAVMSMNTIHRKNSKIADMLSVFLSCRGSGRSK